MNRSKMVVERDRCPSCDHTAFSVLAQEPFDSPPFREYFAAQYEGRADVEALAGANYELVRCTHCGLGYQRTVPGPALLDELYEHWLPQSEKERLYNQYSLDDFRYLDEQVQFLVQHFKTNPSSIRVFDFGLGWGEWATMAKAFGCQVAGSELSPARVENAQSNGIEIVGWDDIPNRRFHYINAEQVFEHLLTPVETMKHLGSALEQGGILKVGVPDARAALRELERARTFGGLAAVHRMPVAPLEHVNCFEHGSLVKMAKNAGLQPLRPGLRILYNSSSGWLSLRRAVRLLVRPVYRHWYPRTTFVYFVKA
jgi:hypothetical protein